MRNLIRNDARAKIAIAIFALFTLWWIILQFSFEQKDLLNKFFGGLYGFMALWGGICGFYVAKKWGGAKSIIGMSILMFSLGLFAQEVGQLVYFSYIFYANIQIPYPSWGDFGYFGSIVFYIYGVFLLGKASGINISLRNFRSKVQAIIIPLLLLIVSYFIFLNGYEFDWSHPLTIFLDFGYPFGQVIYISIALLTYLLSRSVLGGEMKNKVLFILFALLLQYAADFTFLYQSSRDTWQAGGINDYMYLVAYFVMTLGLLQFNTALTQLRQDNK